ncbi:hypothetical protein [Candidatus Mycoplasma mahonii]|uniref:hypothetical protein n=1 Tax=Candidatus Mycoplasma mahonii TaxID=3004105 RepID=UPI0026F041A9|nr:hypothetical protein [Candidatus Mycoplasma mahonii]WKX02541.1 hypothetical protein O3I44_00465 [Candidatus Mycoplasma mahonii]
MIIILFGMGIGVYLITHNSKTKISKRDYIVIKGSGTFYNGPITVPKGTTFEYAIKKLNLQRTRSINEIYEGVGKNKFYHKITDKLFKDITIHIK